ncbi:MAG: NOB1 family endonuclease [Nitrososphaerota archaeon]|jgi:UPF0271 protein|nr:NOB1 family endonuclease [Nitrososphaerota archaeon]
MTQLHDSTRRIAVLDTSAFLAGFDPFATNISQITVPKVETEILRNNMIKLRFQAAIESGKITVKSPNPQYVAKTKTVASKVGDYHKLSETDLQLLALAVELKHQGLVPQIITDDYSIQNVAKQLEIEFLALSTFGIKRRLDWIRYCPACYKQYPQDSKLKQCQVCGTDLKRKPKRSQN